ncbi:MAG: HU family DNA-binding protein [Nostoc sp. DedVER02]|uniref:HU family DNA-binding protein n=1 Tax=unclassified Nostoc TaxID=2593658 RepID=UPI002AD584C1|nr:MULTISPECIES: HU family DNA-binding protein [unclassified Nostoc]MDZ7986837.1 HU family DNA-binding protein [Nostoc sp. DedVER02]MDZ8115739.1 HU family DNA-binding protein [Nostoc sp. DedVER01b]
MNKAELIQATATKAGISQKQAETVLNATLETIVETVSTGGKVVLVGFGSFEARARKEREGRNPKTNEKMVIAATIVPAFSPGKQFRESTAATLPQAA